MCEYAFKHFEVNVFRAIINVGIPLLYKVISKAL